MNSVNPQFSIAGVNDRSETHTVPSGRKASTSFLKKRSKKLLRAVARCPGTKPQKVKSFLVLFFKKEHFSSLVWLAYYKSGDLTR